MELGERNRKADLTALLPVIPGQPGIWHLTLFILAEFLAEKPQVIIQAHAISRQAKTCNGIKEAGCQTTQSAIPQRGFFFQILQICHAKTSLCKKLIHGLIPAQINQIVRQKFSNQKLC